MLGNRFEKLENVMIKSGLPFFGVGTRPEQTCQGRPHTECSARGFSVPLL